MTYLQRFDRITQSRDSGGDDFHAEIFMDGFFHIRSPRKMFKGFLRCLFLLGLTFSGAAMADFGCPPGEEPYTSSTNPSGCWPIATQEAPRQFVPPAMVSQWGAVAMDGQYIGAANGKMSQEEAVQVAQDDCKAKGGSQCKAEVYANGCAATAAGTKHHIMFIADTVENATKIALATCKVMGMDNKECKIVYSGCSLPFPKSPLLRFLKKLGIN